MNRNARDLRGPEQLSQSDCCGGVNRQTQEVVDENHVWAKRLQDVPQILAQGRRRGLERVRQRILVVEIANVASQRDCASW